MPRVKLFLIITFAWMFITLPSHAQFEDVDWTIEKTRVYENGPGTPVEGTRWSIGSQRDEILFIIHFDAKTDMSFGNWYGEIRAKEKFYVTTSTELENGMTLNFKGDDARARGPDASNWGGWKDGPATVPFQSMVFELDRERIYRLKNDKNLVVKYSSFDDKDNKRNINFPLGTFAVRLDEVDKDIAANGGGFFLKTRNEVENMPFGHLPSFVSDPMMKDLKTISEKTGKPISDLIHLSINDIKKANKAADKAADEARLAEIKAKHKAIYDQEPEWMDLNLCPKPDVSFCQNMGKEAYSDDIWGDFTFGTIQGVVWRPKGSIFRIYAGIPSLNKDPEVIRAKEGGYYYIIKSDTGYLDLRRADAMLVR